MKQKTCFVISSIGSENDEKRRKADALLEYVIKKALEPMGYEVTRADAIAAPNSINRGIVEHLEDSDLVVADIHDHNPNVFYELGIRNVVNKPTILFKQQDGHPPFDVQEKRAINHPFPKIGSEYGEEIRQKYKNDIDRAIKELKDHVDAAKKNPVAASESIASLYLKRIKIIDTLGNQKKNLTYAVIISTVVMAGILSFLTFSTMDYEDKLDKVSLSNWNQDLHEQSRQIESDIYNHIDMVIFATLEFDTQIKYMYDEGPLILGSTHQTPAEFIEGLREHGNFVGPFKKEFQTTPLSSYLYLHEHGDPCTFVAYAYLDKMKRDGFADDVKIEKIGRGLQSCDLMDKYELIVADIHVSTGTIDYSFPIARNVDLISNDNKVDMVIATSIDLVKFSEQIRSSIHLDDVRFVLENKYSQVVFDCMKDACPLNYKDDIAREEDQKGVFTKHSKPLTYNLGDFSGYEEYDIIKLDNNKLTNPPKNSILLEGWTLHVLLPKDD